jgi:hypothetical protein
MSKPISLTRWVLLGFTMAYAALLTYAIYDIAS